MGQAKQTVEHLMANVRNVPVIIALVKKLSHDMATRWYVWIADDKPEDLHTFSKWISI